MKHPLANSLLVLGAAAVLSSRSPLTSPVATPDPFPRSLRVASAPVSQPVRVEPIQWVAESEWRREQEKRPGAWVWVSCELPDNQCRTCAIVKRDVYTNDAVRRQSREFICVRLTTPDALRRWKVKSVPSSVFVKPDGNIFQSGGLSRFATSINPTRHVALLDAVLRSSQQSQENQP